MERDHTARGMRLDKSRRRQDDRSSLQVDAAQTQAYTRLRILYGCEAASAPQRGQAQAFTSERRLTSAGRPSILRGGFHRRRVFP